MGKTAKYYDAKRMYTEECLEIPEIAKRLAIDLKPIYRWKMEDKAKRDDWDKSRESLRMTSFSAYKHTLKICVDKIQKMAMTGKIDVKEADAIIKMVKAVKSLYKDVDTPGNVILALNELIDWCNAGNHGDVVEALAPVLPEFGEYISRKYGKRQQ